MPSSAPFLFFNGNTFADIGRQIVASLFADLPTTRRREVMSAAAHYVAGVLEREHGRALTYRAHASTQAEALQKRFD